MSQFLTHQKVMFQHCDPAGIVFYPRYFEMINATVETWFDEGLQAPFSRIHMEQGHAVPTVDIHTRFSAPSRLGDLLEMTLDVVKIGTSSMTLTVTARSGLEERFSADLTLVHIAQQDGKPRPWPVAIRQNATSFMKGEL
ncbi:acyl-CoA thioesterase [Sneathiella chinensis]|uniref:4-hydroxybenzoyl-CoA thioesterase n=1 Tax=Sneathiella chinensis TaxID=349750 RepID=A0ABQ5TZC8_9PROT|nr:thioesterase family protein [Sneathiella chinensis]GLQ04843.1 4-hydroxybenzoyl-CoA thioesterase [Sneathiella chinensis]